MLQERRDPTHNRETQPDCDPRAISRSKALTESTPLDLAVRGLQPAEIGSVGAALGLPFADPVHGGNLIRILLGELPLSSNSLPLPKEVDYQVRTRRNFRIGPQFIEEAEREVLVSFDEVGCSHLGLAHCPDTEYPSPVRGMFSIRDENPWGIVYNILEGLSGARSTYSPDRNEAYRTFSSSPTFETFVTEEFGAASELALRLSEHVGVTIEPDAPSGNYDYSLRLPAPKWPSPVTSQIQSFPVSITIHGIDEHVEREILSMLRSPSLMPYLHSGILEHFTKALESGVFEIPNQSYSLPNETKPINVALDFSLSLEFEDLHGRELADHCSALSPDGAVTVMLLDSALDITAIRWAHGEEFQPIPRDSRGNRIERSLSIMLSSPRQLPSSNSLDARWDLVERIADIVGSRGHLSYLRNNHSPNPVQLTRVDLPHLSIETALLNP